VSTTRVTRHIRAPRAQVYGALLDPESVRGRFVSLVPDTEVVQAVEFESDDLDVRGEMTITYTLTDVAGGTDLVGLHENVPPGVAPADNEVGWNMSMDKLARLLEDD